MITILGAGGAIGNELAKLLAARHPWHFAWWAAVLHPVSGAREVVSADVNRQGADDSGRSRIEHGPPAGRLEVRRQGLGGGVATRHGRHAIEACKRAEAKLIFFDNVYMYGKVDGPMTEETPFNPRQQEGRNPRTHRDHADGGMEVWLADGDDRTRG